MEKENVIKRFKPGDDIPTVKPYDWDLVIHGRPYYVGRFPGFVHTIGGKWADNNLWAWPRDESPCYDNLVEFDSEYPVQWGIVYDPTVYLKTKYCKTRTRDSIAVTITRNGEKFYTFHGGINYGIDKARVLISEINEHPLWLNTIDYDKKMIDRKVWWRSEPAIITKWIHGQACVILEPDGIEKFTNPPEFEDEHDDYCEYNTVKTTIFDKHIWWFRD